MSSGGGWGGGDGCGTKMVCCTSWRVIGDGGACVTGCDSGGAGWREKPGGGEFGDNRITPGRSGDRSYARRSRLIRREGSDSRNIAAVSGSLGVAVKPAGSISRRSVEGE